MPEPDLYWLYRNMRLIREFETRVEQLHVQGRLRGSFHSSVGQESSAAGVCHALRQEDIVTSTHRGHGHALAKGVPPGAIMAELFGRATGTSSGRGGSMHLHHKASGFLGQNAIVAGSMPWAAGAAWARQRLGQDSVAVSFIGDGAYGQGLFYETLRLATLYGSPCLFVCENNGYAHSMPSSVLAGEPGAIAKAVAGLGVQSLYVDGEDVVEVWSSAQKMIDIARSGQPGFLEVRVVRVKAHSLSDPDYRYRPRDEGVQWLELHDPIDALRARIGDDGERRVQRIDEEVTRTIDSAVSHAEASPEPSPVAASADILNQT